MRVERTFAFVDLCGFTRYTDLSGDGAAVAVIAQLRGVLRAVSAQCGVRVVKWLGDGAMLSGLEAESVTRCALQVRDHIALHGPLPVRTGIARGPVIMFDGDDYVGAAANLAAHLCRAARPNHVLAAADLLERVADSPIAVRRLEALRIEGIDGVVPVVEVLGGPSAELLVQRRALRATP
jgi:class 3 adenylate cyclase